MGVCRPPGQSSYLEPGIALAKRSEDGWWGKTVCGSNCGNLYSLLPYKD